MKIWLDRRVCSLWDAACESDFASCYLGDELIPTACTVKYTEEDNRDELVFYITDRDGSDKEFVVTDENRPEAIDSWFLALQSQQAEHAHKVPMDQVR